MKLSLTLSIVLLYINLIGSPGFTKSEVIDYYFDVWNLESIETYNHTEVWYLSLNHHGVKAKMFIIFCNKKNIVIETKGGYYCYNSGKRIWKLLEENMVNIGKGWYIQQPCTVSGYGDYWIIINIELYQNHYTVTRKLWKKGTPITEELRPRPLSN